MKKTIQLKESDITRMVMEAVNELDWKTYADAAKKSYEQGRDSAWDFSRAAERELNKKYPHSSHHVTPSDERVFQRFDRNSDWTAWRPMAGHENSWPAWVEHGTNAKVDPESWAIDYTPKDDEKEIGDFVKGNYEYKPYKEGGEGWTKKNESIVREAVNRTLRKYIK